MRSFSISAAGAQAANKSVEVIANNIANAQTTAFKRQILLTKDLEYQSYPVKAVSDTVVPTQIQFGSGVAVAAVVKDRQQGDIIQTGKELDLRLVGKGFFVVNYPDGTQRFTRDGSFQISPDNQIVTKEGYLISPGIGIPENYRKIMVREDGAVLADIGDNQAPQELGQLEIVKFNNEDGLENIGGNYVTFTEASGQPNFGVAGQDDFGRINQGELEGSNIKPVVEMTDLIQKQRLYELNVQVLQKSDQMYKKVTDV